MPRDPEEAFQAAVDVDDEKRWRLKVDTVAEVKSQYNERRKDSVFLSWHFNLYDIDTGELVIDNNSGDAYELWHATNDSTYYNPKAVPPTIGGAREMAHILMGRDLTDAEIKAWNAEGIDGWARALSGKTLIADLEWGVDKKGYNRLSILRTRPDNKAPKAPATPAVAVDGVRSRRMSDIETVGGVTPESAGESTADRRKRVMAELAELEALG